LIAKVPNVFVTFRLRRRFNCKMLQVIANLRLAAYDSPIILVSCHDQAALEHILHQFINNDYQKSYEGYHNSKKEKDQRFMIKSLGVGWVPNS